MMKSLNKYLQKQGQRYHDDVFDVNFNSDIIVVIPCYDEPDIINTLESIRRCDRPESVNLSVIVIINSAVKTDIDVVNRNTKTYQVYPKN
jgi:cellulose synthase/poly-beta-1,6-N-acetylglucosamine synthase-like glycosyltransferase